MVRSLPPTAVALAALLLGASLRADDADPLNLPPPRDPARPGAVVLHGGGPLDDEIFARFIELAGGRHARIVLVPSGTYVRGRNDGVDFDETEAEFERRMARRFGSWVELATTGRIAKFRFLYCDDQVHRDDPAFCAALDDATGVWFPAAYQGKLGWRFTTRYSDESSTRTTLFQQKLRDVVARGGVVGGLGGGASALSEVMIMGDSGQADGPAKANLRYGMALFNGAIVDQNFTTRGGRLERFTGLLKDAATLNDRITWPATARNMIGLAVDPETAMVVQGTAVTTLGRGAGHVFLKSNGDRTVTWRRVTPTDGAVRIVPSALQSPAAAAAAARSDIPPARAANPFGMPEPEPGRRFGTVVVHGGRGDQRMIETFPQLSRVEKPNFVHCPAATSVWRPRPGESRESVLRRLHEDLYEWPTMQREGRLADLNFLTTLDPQDAERPAFVAPLRQAHCVWFSGGDQSKLAELFINPRAPTRFQLELRDVVRRGGVVGGTSAGAAVMAQVMTVGGSPENGLPARAAIAHGFGLLRNVVLEQHFQGDGRAGRIERFTQLLLDNERLRSVAGGGSIDGPVAPEAMIGLAVEEKTALLIEGNRLRVFGKARAHVFLKSTDQKAITWHELQPGDAAIVTPTADGPNLELEAWQVR
jgi:cyanophycinase